MTWVLIVGAWIVVAVVVALVIGRSIGLADRQSAGSRNFVVDDLPVPPPVVPPARPASPAEHPSGPLPEMSFPPAGSGMAAGDGQDPTTIPSLPSARPSLPRPPVPPPRHAAGPRETEAG